MKKFKKVSVRRMIFLMGLYCVFANIVHPIEPTIYTDLGFHDYMFGVAMAAMSLTNFLFAPFWGNLMERYGCAKLTGVAFLGYAFSQYLFAISKTEPFMAFARLMAGIFISAISVSQLLYLMRYSGRRLRAHYLMVNATVSAVCSPLGYLIGGVMGEYTIWGTMMTQVVGLAVIGILFFVLLDDRNVEGGSLDVKELLADMNPLKSFGDIRPYLNAALVVFFIIAFATNFAGVCYEHSFNYLIKDEYGFSPAYNGLLKAVVGVVALVSNTTICSYLLRKTNVRRSTIVVLSVCAAMAVSIVLIKPLLPFIAINVVFFGFNAVYLPLLQDTLTRIAGERDHGLFAGVFNAVRSVGSVGGSLVAGFTYAISSRLPFVVTASLFTLAVICAVVNFKQLSAKAEATK